MPGGSIREEALLREVPLDHNYCLKCSDIHGKLKQVIPPGGRTATWSIRDLHSFPWGPCLDRRQTLANEKRPSEIRPRWRPPSCSLHVCRARDVLLSLCIATFIIILCEYSTLDKRTCWKLLALFSNILSVSLYFVQVCCSFSKVVRLGSCLRIFILEC